VIYIEIFLSQAMMRIMQNVKMHNIRKAIATRINDNMQQLGIIQTQIAQLKMELEQFLNQYFAIISKNLPPYLLTAAKPSLTPVMQGYSNNFDTIIKQLYRTLAKHFHPDMNNGDNRNMQILNEAYQHKQLGSLMLLESEIGANNEILQYSLDDLLHYHELVQTSLIQAEAELTALQQCEAIRLKQNILLARLHGYDMMSAVAMKMAQKYTVKEHMMVEAA
jgi:hypothetical protein